MFLKNVLLGASLAAWWVAGVAAQGAAPTPVLPQVMTRDAEGRATIRAVRVATPLRLDGRLDESIYSEIPAVSGFTQTEPQNGAPSTQPTDVWLLFDDRNIYVGLRAWDANPERIISTEMRHDAPSLTQHELLTVSFDTYFDRRNAYSFCITPAGGRCEGQISNERQYQGDWNGIWSVSTGRGNDGWTAEIAIPFKTLRYRQAVEQTWGMQVQRVHRWKNELSFLNPVDPSLGTRGFMQASAFATVVGLEVPPPGRNLEIKPYAISDLTTDRTTRPPISNDGSADVGLDVKYGVTENLTFDLTYNTDFAQVEADEQQINLTRFSLFFPEKREFFLENSGTFNFGGTTSGPLGVAGDAPIMFYSRRIGLSGSREVPLLAGARLTGRVGKYTVGFLDIQSEDEPLSATRASNFAVVRVKRDILRRSAIGVLATGRTVTQDGAGYNQAFGLDGTFAFYSNLAINTYWARTATTGRRGEDASYRAQLDYTGDRYGVQAEHMLVGRNFNPELGFRRRTGIRKSAGLFRFSPRTRGAARVRKYSYTGAVSQIATTGGHVESRELSGEFGIEFHSSAKMTAAYLQMYEFLPVPFHIAPGVIVPIGGYDFAFARGSFSFQENQSLVFGTVTVERGAFYGGDRTTLTLQSARLAFMPGLAFQPSGSVNNVDLPGGSFTATLLGSRITYSITPLMFVGALIQYNSTSRTIATNVRLRWEYRPGSELFVVYNDQRDTLTAGIPDLTNRAFIVKVN